MLADKSIRPHRVPSTHSSRASTKSGHCCLLEEPENGKPSCLLAFALAMKRGLGQAGETRGEGTAALVARREAGSGLGQCSGAPPASHVTGGPTVSPILPSPSNLGQLVCLFFSRHGILWGWGWGTGPVKSQFRKAEPSAGGFNMLPAAGARCSAFQRPSGWTEPATSSPGGAACLKGWHRPNTPRVLVLGRLSLWVGPPQIKKP